MAFISKKRKVVDTKVDANKNYSLKDASALVKQVTTCKFDASVDLHIRLGVDPKKADQAIRGTVTLPHGTGKTKRVLVLCTPDKEAEAKAAVANMKPVARASEDLLAAGTTLDAIAREKAAKQTEAEKQKATELAAKKQAEDASSCRS
mgnify:CR=1 FL=1